MSDTSAVRLGPSPYQQAHSFCCNSSLIKIVMKISLVGVGLLLIGSAIAAHMYQVNAIPVYTMGGFGGVLILATAIGSIIQCFLQKHSHEHPRRPNNSLCIDESNCITKAVPWWGVTTEPYPLPEDWKKCVADQTMTVSYGNDKVTIPKGDTYFTYLGKIAIGWHGTYDPPCGM